jgi:hypothetical protein
MAFSPTPPQNPQKKKTAYPDLSIYLGLQIAPRLAFAKPHHTKQVNLLLRFANPKASKKVRLLAFSQYLSLFLPAHSPRSKSLLKQPSLKN